MSEKKVDVFFDKAVFGGYDTTQVDEFVEEARKMISGLKKENEVLKQKLTILADKIEEYQASEQNAASVSEPVSETPVATPTETDVSEQQLTSLREQIAAEQSTLEALMAEKTVLAASIAKQYELCLQAMQGEAVIAPLAEISAEETAVLEQPVELEALNDSAEPEEDVSTDETEPNEVILTESEESAAEPLEETIDVAEEPVAEPINEETEASVEEQQEAPAEEDPVPSIAETVEVGESVYLNTTAAEVATLSYEEALAMVLKKNGIIRTQPTAQSAAQSSAEVAPVSQTVREISDAIDAPQPEKKDDSQTTKIIPRIQTVTVSEQNPPAEKPQKKKKEHSFFGNLRKTIHNFLEDASDDDLDVFTPAAKKPTDKESELQFGKAYNVKNNQ